MYMYESYNYGGMNMIWWFIWMMLLLWIFALPYNIPGQRMKKNSPLYILQQRLAAGSITNDEYQEKKKIIENDQPK